MHPMSQSVNKGACHPLGTGMLQKDVAKVLGVSASAVTGWEKNRHQPHLASLPKIFKFLKYTFRNYKFEIILYRQRHPPVQSPVLDGLGQMAYQNAVAAAKIRDRPRDLED